MKGYEKFPFEERKNYEETFVQNNSALIWVVGLEDCLKLDNVIIYK